MTEPYIIAFKKIAFNQLLHLDRKIIDTIVLKLLRLAQR